MLLHSWSSRFNDKLLALRQEKRDIIKTIEGLKQQLFVVQEKLDRERHLPIPLCPKMKDDEEVRGFDSNKYQFW